MTRLLIYILAAAAVLSLCLSCSKSTSGNGANVPVEIAMSVNENAVGDFQVEVVQLYVHADDMSDILLDLPVVEGKVSAVLDVPPGPNRIFEMEATDGRERVIYAGTTTVDIGQGLDQDVNIVLHPVGLMLRTSPMYQELSAGTTGQLEVYVFNVDSLFGAGFRIYYDPAILEISGSSAGDFLGTGEDIIYFARGEEGEREYYAIAVTRLRPEEGTSVGISGSGKLATVDFTTLVPGTTEISIGIEADYALNKPDGFAVDRIEELVLDGSTIVVRGAAR